MPVAGRGKVASASAWVRASGRARGGQVAGALGTALELLSPALEGSGVRAGAELAQASAAVVAAERGPGLGGHFCELVDGAQAGDFGVGGHDLAPEGVLLGAVEEESCLVSVEQELPPEAVEPGVEWGGRWRGPPVAALRLAWLCQSRGGGRGRRAGWG